MRGADPLRRQVGLAEGTVAVKVLPTPGSLSPGSSRNASHQFVPRARPMPEPSPSSLGALDPVEAVKILRAFLCRDAGAGIAYLKLCRAVDGPQANRDAPGQRELEGVGNQVE